MEKTLILIVGIIATVGGQLLAAQFVDFGLAQFHVQAGLLGPFWIMLAVSIACQASVRTAK